MNRLTKISTQVAAAMLAWGFVLAAAQPSFAGDKSVDAWFAKQEQALMQKLESRVTMPVVHAPSL